MAASRPNRAVLVAPLLAALAGCAAQGTFPSLQPRAIEQSVATEVPARAQVPVASEPALRARAAELLALARRGQGDFDTAHVQASAAAARAGASGTESWTLAQQAISRVEAARDETTRALAELDQLVVARAGQPTNQEDFEAIHSALTEAQRLAEEQQARLARLRARVGSG